jgi:predicted N-acetyltransferase YhbS
MNNQYIIRQERQTEYHEVENLVREAFWNVYQPGCPGNCGETAKLFSFFS